MKLILCSYCGMGVGKFEFKSASIEGIFCSSDCYSSSLMEQLGFNGIKGRFFLKTDGHGGVVLLPNN